MLPEMGVVLGKMGEGGQKMQTLNFKVSQSWGCNIQHGNHSLKHCIGYLKISKRDLKSFHQQKKIFVTMYGDRC